MNFIFNKASKEILYITATPRQAESEKAACLANDGGVEADYLFIEDSLVASGGVIPQGMVPTLDNRNKVVLVKHPTVAAQETARASLETKLTALGLTASEIKVL